MNNTFTESENKLLEIWTGLAGKDEHSIEVFNKVMNVYRSGNRHYHSLSQMIRLINQLESLKLYLKNSESVFFAAFYHDLVYEPFKFDNEIKSAAKAVSDLKMLNIDATIINKTEYIILCTKDHTNPLNDHDTDIFMDCDLMILASVKEQYLQYVELLRHEYKHLTEKSFIKGRLTFIDSYLVRPRIYRSQGFYQSYEKLARQNLQVEKQFWAKKLSNQ